MLNQQHHDEVQGRLYNDQRLPPGTRELALAMTYVLYREPEHPPGGGYWRRLRELLGRDGITTRAGHGWRIHDLIAGDAPRYDPGGYSRVDGSCEGPRVRPYRPRRPAWTDRCLVSGHHPHLGDCRYTQISYATDAGLTATRPAGWPADPERDDRVCGAHATIAITEYDMVTGWETVRWFCSRHRGRAAEVKAQLAGKGPAPDPIPNRGGHLPRYFTADWAAIYAKHCGLSLRPGATCWRSPYHGLNADDWPVPGRTAVPRRPRLSIVADAS